MSLKAVYASDKVSAEICSRMQVVGFGWDPDRARQFSSYLKQIELDTMAVADSVVRPIKRGKSGGFSSNDLQRLFFEELRAPQLFFSDLTGRPQLNVDALQAYSNGRNEALSKLSSAVLKFRRAQKLRATYIDGITVGSDGRVHASWQNYGTISGRWSCSGPNLANLPRGVNDYTAPMGGIRSLYIARSGCVLVGYDKSQIEFRIASYGSGDEAMIAVCEGGDVHSMNASSLFADFIVTEYATFKKRIKAEDTLSPSEEARFVGLDGLRTLAKSAVFAICYLAEAQTVYQRIIASGVRGVTLRMVETMLANMKKKFAHYYKWQNARLLDCIRTGYVYSPILGRRRWLGHDPAPTEAANFPIQGGAADVMNAEIPRIFAAVRRDVPSAELVAHVYDSVYFDVPASAAGLTQRICLDISLQPVTISSSGVTRQMVLPVDMGMSDRWK